MTTNAWLVDDLANMLDALNDTSAALLRVGEPGATAFANGYAAAIEAMRKSLGIVAPRIRVEPRVSSASTFSGRGRGKTR